MNLDFKKIRNILLSIMIISQITCSANLASEVSNPNAEKIIENNQEILAYQLEARVEANDISDGIIELSQSVEEKENIKITKTESEQLLSKKINESGCVVENYVAAVFCRVEPLVDMIDGSQTVGSSNTTYTKENTECDTSFSCDMTVKIYYTKIFYENRDCIYLSKVYCAASEPTPYRVNIVDAKLTMGQSGFTPGGFVNQHHTYNAVSYTHLDVYKRQVS